MAWIGVDLDGTLAIYPPAERGGIGEPLLPMVEKVRVLVLRGFEVRIFTARQGQDDLIREWCRRNIGYDLAVTDRKDFACIAIYDDIAHKVERNTGLCRE